MCHGARPRRLGLGAALSRAACGDRPSRSAEPRAGTREAGVGGSSSLKAMWPAGAGTKLPCPRDSALRRAAFSGNLTALPSHLMPAGRSVRVFISANPEGKSFACASPSVLLSVYAAEPECHGTAGRAVRPRRSLPLANTEAVLSAWDFNLNHFSSSLAHSFCLLTSPGTPISRPLGSFPLV